MTFVQWQTAYDESTLFADVSPTSPINFSTPGATGSADISVDDTVTYQTIAGFGGSLSKCLVLKYTKMYYSG